jgi:hypothetical protein
MKKIHLEDQMAIRITMNQEGITIESVKMLQQKLLPTKQCRQCQYEIKRTIENGRRRHG